MRSQWSEVLVNAPSNIETEPASSAAAAAARWGDQLPSELCKLGLELSEMIAGGLVFLGYSGVQLTAKVFGSYKLLA